MTKKTLIELINWVNYIFENFVCNILLNKISKIKGLTPLHQAVIENSLDMIKILLDKQANVNCIDDNLWTPLHCAAKMGI